MKCSGAAATNVSTGSICKPASFPKKKTCQGNACIVHCGVFLSRNRKIECPQTFFSTLLVLPSVAAETGTRTVSPKSSVSENVYHLAVVVMAATGSAAAGSAA